MELEYYIDEEGKKRVKINGICDENSWVSEYLDGMIYIHDEEVIGILENEKIIDLCDKFKGFNVDMFQDYFPKSITGNDSSSIELESNENNAFIKFKFQYDYELWNNLFSIKEIGVQLKDICSAFESLKFKNDDMEDEEDSSILNGFSMIFEIEDTSKTFGEEIKSKQIIVNNIFNMAVENLTQNKNKLNFEFVVDENIKVVCEQYLIYFIQFLKDLGINAHSEISSEKFKIFFSVIPEDNRVALEQIRNALDVYLELPKFQNAIMGNDIAIYQLQATVNHLNSQLALAKATLLAQEKTILALELLSSKEILVSDKKNEEEVLGGILKITEYEKNGIKVNFPQILRLLKRKF